MTAQQIVAKLARIYTVDTDQLALIALVLEAQEYMVRITSRHVPTETDAQRDKRSRSRGEP